MRVLVLLLLLGAKVAFADSPARPQVVTETSANGLYRARNVPNEVWERGKAIRQKRPGLVLEKKTAKGWREVWHHEPLDYRVPDLMVPDSGEHVVLFHWAGDVNDAGAVVIAGPGGKVVRLAPRDFLSEAEQKHVSRSVSHINWAPWGAQHRFDEKRGELVLAITQSGNLPPIYAGKSIERRIELATGAVVREGAKSDAGNVTAP